MTDDNDTRLDAPAVLRLSRRLTGASDALAKSSFEDLDVPWTAFGDLPAAHRMATLHEQAHRLASAANAADVVKLSEFGTGLKASVEYLDDADREAQLNLARIAEAEPEGGW